MGSDDWAVTRRPRGSGLSCFCSSFTGLTAVCSTETGCRTLTYSSIPSTLGSARRASAMAALVMLARMPLRLHSACRSRRGSVRKSMLSSCCGRRRLSSCPVSFSPRSHFLSVWPPPLVRAGSARLS
uniref:Uncharacterized protein n=1 Tax=Zea mays TaxID=4577 RepID=C4J044_MAIZE|nr:unknown [Zea mays]